MLRSLKLSTPPLPAAIAAAIAAAALAGCGSGGSAPHATPVSSHFSHYEPAPPRLPANRPRNAILVLDLTDTAQVKPSQLAFASDGSVRNVRWTGWGRSIAYGHGAAVLRVCTPNCAQGHNRTYPVTVTLSTPVKCFGARFYASSRVVVASVSGQQQLASSIRNPC